MFCKDFAKKTEKHVNFFFKKKSIHNYILLIFEYFVVKIMFRLIFIYTRV